jgi:DNA mismatch repair protein MutS
MSRLDPSEILVQETLLESDPVVARSLSERKNLMVNRYPDWAFDLELSYERLKKQLGVSNLKGFGFDYPIRPSFLRYTPRVCGGDLKDPSSAY